MVDATDQTSTQEIGCLCEIKLMVQFSHTLRRFAGLMQRMRRRRMRWLEGRAGVWLHCCNERVLLF